MGIQWKESLAIGVEEIDNQHKELFEAINKLLDACSMGRGKEEVGNLVKFLGDYVVKHFNAEEKLQQKYSYPDYRSHKQLHDKFIEDFNSLSRKFDEEGPTLSAVQLTNRLVVDWLVKHIGSVDKALGAYIKGKA